MPPPQPENAHTAHREGGERQIDLGDRAQLAIDPDVLELQLPPGVEPTAAGCSTANVATLYCTREPNGQPIGSLCLPDMKPRQLTERERRLLREYAKRSVPAMPSLLEAVPAA